jgi:hypothetical protein
MIERVFDLEGFDPGLRAERRVPVVFAEHVVKPERAERNAVATLQFDSEEAPDAGSS